MSGPEDTAKGARDPFALFARELALPRPARPPSPDDLLEPLPELFAGNTVRAARLVRRLLDASVDLENPERCGLQLRAALGQITAQLKADENALRSREARADFYEELKEALRLHMENER